MIKIRKCFPSAYQDMETADAEKAVIIELAGMKLASLTQYLGVVFVAMLLTVIELQTFGWTVIPGVRQGIYEQLRESASRFERSMTS